MNKNVLDDFVSLAARLKNNLNKSRKSLNQWDLKSLDKLLASCRSDIERLSNEWETRIPSINQEIAQVQEMMKKETYISELEEALRKAGIPVRGSFPAYEFPPFKLSVDIGEGTARLSLGRKQEKTTALLPGEIAAWASKQYDRIVKRKSDHQRFCRDLLAAYEKANRLSFKGDSVLWGKAVSLNNIYELLTLRQASRGDYPREVFIYELARLKEQPEIRYREYRFELGFSRNVANTLLIVDHQGRESRVGSLIIYKEG